MDDLIEVFKVVRIEEDGKFYSPSGFNTLQSRVLYELGVGSILPFIEGSKLLAYVSLSAAMHHGFMYAGPYAILRCHTSEALPVKILLGSTFTNELWEEAVRRFWDEGDLETQKIHTMKAPRGTVACPWLLPIEVMFRQPLQSWMRAATVYDQPEYEPA